MIADDPRMREARCAACGGSLSAEGTAADLCPACVFAAALAPAHAFATITLESSLNHVRMVTVIGESPRAVVYLGEWLTPAGGFVVVKRSRVTAPARPQPDTILARLMDLDHPRIAAVFDCGVDDSGRRYVVTDWVPGMPLVRFCDSTRATFQDRLELIVQAAETLEYAHARGVYHLNLKPSNVLAMPLSGITLLDFDAALPGDAAAGSSDLVSLGALTMQVLANAVLECGGSTRLEEARDIARRAVAATGEEGLRAFSCDFSRLAALE